MEHVKKVQLTGRKVAYQRIMKNANLVGNGAISTIITLPEGTAAMQLILRQTTYDDVDLQVYTVDADGNMVAGLNMATKAIPNQDGFLIVDELAGNNKVAIYVKDKSGIGHSIDFVDVYSRL